MSKNIFYKLITDLTNYISDSYFNMDNMDRYMAYKIKYPNYDYANVVNYFNLK